MYAKFDVFILETPILPLLFILVFGKRLCSKDRIFSASIAHLARPSTSRALCQTHATCCQNNNIHFGLISCERHHTEFDCRCLPTKQILRYWRTRESQSISQTWNILKLIGRRAHHTIKDLTKAILSLVNGGSQCISASRSRL